MPVRQGVAVLGACLGALAAVSFKKIGHRTLCILISFAAGSLLAVSLFDIVPETFASLGAVQALFSILSGYALFWVVTRFVSHICPACAATHTEVDFKAVTITMIVALSIHSFMDGLAIYSSLSAASSVSVQLFAAVLFHKIPEGMALTLIARGSGYSRLKAFGITALLEGITTFAGGFAGFFWVPASTQWAAWVLGHVGGGFIFLVIHALLSEVFKHHPRSTVIAASAGAVSILLIGGLVGAH